MPLHFTCPHCRQETLVDEQYAGLSGPCAICGKLITVPYFSDSPSEAGIAGATAEDVFSTPPTAARPRSVGVIALLIFAGVVTSLALAGLLLAVFFPLLSKARTVAHRERSGRNLQQIATALNAYAEQYGAYPPARILDDRGQPLHSWRVLILPFLGEQNLYSRYDFTQPWDGPQNIALLSEMPEVFASPGDLQAVTLSETSYMVVRGAETAFPPGPSAVGMKDLLDGLSSTVLVVEVAGTGVGWLEPVDLDINKMTFEINRGPASEIGSVYAGGAHVVTADQVAHFLANDTLPEYVRAMLTIDQGDYVPWDQIAP